MRRYGQVIKVKPEAIEEYERLHAAVWPDVLTMIHTCNIRNYSIFRYQDWLFAYFEYIGDNFEADMQKMAADPRTREWWSYTDPLQQPVEDRVPGEWWASMKEIFHTP